VGTSQAGQDALFQIFLSPYIEDIAEAGDFANFLDPVPRGFSYLICGKIAQEQFFPDDATHRK
jgi:hypothetical protein